MLEQFGNVLAFEYKKIFESVETKKKKIRDHYEANKDTAKQTFERILVILEEAKQKFDFSNAVAQYEIRTEIVYLSASGGAKDWSFPLQKDISWHNPLTAITKSSDYQFNFIFKNGLSSDAPMSG